MKELWMLVRRCHSFSCIWRTVIEWLKDQRWSQDTTLDEAQDWLAVNGVTAVRDYWIFDIAVPDEWVGVFVGHIADRYVRINEASMHGWTVLVFPENSTGEYIGRETMRALQFGYEDEK